jgi:NADH-quinone oxidoreductase subunit N
MRLTLSINGIAVLLLGLLPGPLMTACVYSISQALAS